MDRPKILVVDDEVLLAAYMEELLTDAGYDVTLATRGDLALSTFANGQFAGLVTDIRMPGVDGW